MVEPRCTEKGLPRTHLWLCVCERLWLAEVGALTRCVILGGLYLAIPPFFLSSLCPVYRNPRWIFTAGYFAHIYV